LKPALRRHHAVSGIDPKYDPVRELLTKRIEPFRRLKRPCADHHSLESPGKSASNLIFSPQSAAKLARYATGPHDGLDTLGIHGPAIAGAIQVHQVEKRRSLFDPQPRHGRRVIAKNGLLLVVSLPQPDAASAANVDGR
jgi:hypothetical protein